MFDELQLKEVIPEAADAIGWRVPPRTKVELRPEENEVVSFAHFHSFWVRGAGAPLTPVVVVLLWAPPPRLDPRGDPPPLRLHHVVRGLPRSPYPL